MKKLIKKVVEMYAKSSTNSCIWFMMLMSIQKCTIFQIY